MFGPDAVEGPMKILDPRLAPIVTGRIVAEWQKQARAWNRTRFNSDKADTELHEAFKGK